MRRIRRPAPGRWTLQPGTAEFAVVLRSPERHYDAAGYPSALHLLVVFVCLPVLAQKAAIDPSLLKRANAGDAQAQLKLGEGYLSGISVAQDYAKATSWFEKAAD